MYSRVVHDAHDVVVVVSTSSASSLLGFFGGCRSKYSLLSTLFLLLQPLLMISLSSWSVENFFSSLMTYHPLLPIVLHSFVPILS